MRARPSAPWFVGLVLRAGALATAPVALAAGQDPPLFAGVEYPTGAKPVDLARGDLDGDGLPDLVVAIGGDELLTTFRSNGAGALIHVQDVSTGGRPAALALGDLDGDGALDAVAALPFAGALAVFRGDGVGGLSAQGSYPAGSSPVAVSLGDLDADGALDAVAPGQHQHELAVLLGDGAGGFGPPTGVPSPGVPVFAALGDVDNNGTVDLVVASKGYSLVSLHHGDGLGGFGAPATWSVGGLPVELALADLDGNGWLDVAVACELETGALLLLGGPGGFTASLTGGLHESTAVAIADLDRDGDLDLAYTPDDGDPYFINDVVSIQLGNGEGSFHAPAVGAQVPAGLGAHDLVVGDFELDGELDLATANSELESLSLRRGLGGGTYLWPEPFAPSADWLGSYAIGAEALDADGDGALDLAVLVTRHSTAGADKVGVAMGDGVGGFTSAAVFHDLPQWTGGFAAGDLNADGLADVIAGRYPGPATPYLVHSYLGDGAGGLVDHGPSPAVPGSVQALALADFDLDGVLDAVGATNLFGPGSDVGSLHVLPGDGAGGFRPGGQIASGDFFGVAAGDLDGDGAPDVAGGDYYDSRLLILHNDGSGGFGAPSILPVPDNPWATAIAELTGDGIADLVHSSVGGPVGQLWLHVGDGQGGLLPPVAHEAGRGAHDIELGDLNLDGRPDVAVSNTWEGTLSVFLADGAGGLEEQQLFDGDGSPQPLVAADVDADGRLDLVSTHVYSNTALVYRNLVGDPVGLGPYGNGTPGCNGTHGLTANLAPAVGEGGFTLYSAGAPASGWGLGLISSGADFAGSDPLGLGVSLHVDLTAPGLWIDAGFASDALGQGSAPLPVPAKSSLVGKTLYVQALWWWSPPCAPSPLGLSSSRGLRLTIQP